MPLSSCVPPEWLEAWPRAPLFASWVWQEPPGHPPARVATYVRNEVTCSNLSSFQPRAVHRTGWNKVVGPVIRGASPRRTTHANTQDAGRRIAGKCTRLELPPATESGACAIVADGPILVIMGVHFGPLGSHGDSKAKHAIDVSKASPGDV